MSVAGITLAYPSGDDHPSEKGSQKATGEFIPLLNVFYHNWKANAPVEAPVEAPAESDAPEPAQESGTAAGAEAPAGVLAVSGMIDAFEGGDPAGTNGWEPFWGETAGTSMHCAAETGMAYQGNQALKLDFDVTPNDWATCALFYDDAQDWSASQGIGFYLHAAQAGLIFDVNIYAGSAEGQETYLDTIETPADSMDGWVPVMMYWSDFHRADWEENAGAPFANPERILGLAFGMNTSPDAPNTGTLWVDELSFLEEGGVSMAPAALEEEQTSAAQLEEREEGQGGFSLPCGSAFLLSALLLTRAFMTGRRTIL